MRALVFPRARTLCCEHGFVRWSAFAEGMFETWSEGSGLAGTIADCDRRGTLAFQLERWTVKTMCLISMHMPSGIRTSVMFDVTPVPGLLRTIRRAQRRWRWRRRVLAVAMGWHGRLGRHCALGQSVHADVLQAIARWVW